MSRIAGLLVFFLLLNVSLATPSFAKSHVHKRPPARQGHDITVWVNLRSGIYHYPGTRWYGKTEDGAYMKESQARKDGYRPAENGQ